MEIVEINDELHFGTAYVVQPTHDFSALMEHCETIKYMTSGYDTVASIIETLQDVLSVIDTEMDIIVPSGKNFVNIILGMLLLNNQSLLPFVLCLYDREKGYRFYRVSNGRY